MDRKARNALFEELGLNERPTADPFSDIGLSPDLVAEFAQSGDLESLRFVTDAMAKALAKIYHPDAQTLSSDPVSFQRITEARKTIKDTPDRDLTRLSRDKDEGQTRRLRASLEKAGRTYESAAEIFQGMFEVDFSSEHYISATKSRFVTAFVDRQPVLFRPNDDMTENTIYFGIPSSLYYEDMLRDAESAALSSLLHGIVEVDEPSQVTLFINGDESVHMSFDIGDDIDITADMNQRLQELMAAELDNPPDKDVFPPQRSIVNSLAAKHLLDRDVIDAHKKKLGINIIDSNMKHSAEKEAQKHAVDVLTLNINSDNDKTDVTLLSVTTFERHQPNREKYMLDQPIIHIDKETGEEREQTFGYEYVMESTGRQLPLRIVGSYSASSGLTKELYSAPERDPAAELEMNAIDESDSLPFRLRYVHPGDILTHPDGYTPQLLEGNSLIFYDPKNGQLLLSDIKCSSISGPLNN